MSSRPHKLFQRRDLVMLCFDLCFFFTICLLHHVSKIKKSAGVAPEVNLGIPLHAGKEIHSGFETQMRRHKKSKTGVSVDPKFY